MKTCTKCKIEKEEKEFYTYKYKNNLCIRNICKKM